MRRRSPKLLCEVLKSKNVVCTPNYNVINTYLPFFFFSFFYDNVIAIRSAFHRKWYRFNIANTESLKHLVTTKEKQKKYLVENRERFTPF